MHQSVMAFGASVLKAEHVLGKRVLEVGSLNVNGSLRPHIEALGPAHYIGVDLRPGPGVDLVTDFCEVYEHLQLHHLIVCTEMLEHAPDWRRAVYAIKALLMEGGYLLLTTRSAGFPRHDYPFDFWRFSVDHIQAIFGDLEILNLVSDPDVPGVFLFARDRRIFNKWGVADHRAHGVEPDKHYQVPLDAIEVDRVD